MHVSFVMLAAPEDGISLRDSVHNFRAGGFTDYLDVFAQPSTDLTEPGADMVRVLKQPYGACELWRNTLAWWYNDMVYASHLLLVQGGLSYSTQAADALLALLNGAEDVGAASLFVPQDQQQHFASAGQGWCTTTVPTPPVASLFSREAAKALIDAIALWRLPGIATDWHAQIYNALQQASLLQTVHYPSLCGSTNGRGPQGLMFSAETNFVYGCTAAEVCS